MGFVSELREALSKGTKEFKDLCLKSNSLTKELLEDVTITDSSIGPLKNVEFTRQIRSGEIKEAFLAVKPNLKISDSNVYVISMKREASILPEYHINEAKKISKSLPSELSDISSAEDLEDFANKNSSLKSKLQEAESKAKVNKKYIFMGVAIAATGLGVYEAIEQYAKAKTGCFLYTTNNRGETSVCKVLNASCLNPKPDSTFSTCTASTMGTDLTNVTCKDWSEATNGACMHCDPNNFDYSKLKTNQYMECVEKADFLDAIGDLFYGMGIDFSNLLSSLKTILKWVFVIFVIIFVIVLIVWIFKKVLSHHNSSEQQVQTQAAMPYYFPPMQPQQQQPMMFYYPQPIPQQPIGQTQPIIINTHNGNARQSPYSQF